MRDSKQVKPLVLGVLAGLALLTIAAALPIQRNFFTVNATPVVQTTAGTNCFVTFSQVGATRTYRVDVPTNGASGTTFGILQGTNVVLITNGTVVTIEVPAQTNGFTSIVYSNAGDFLLSSAAILTNHIYATNVLSGGTVPVGAISGLTPVFNGMASTNPIAVSNGVNYITLDPAIGVLTLAATTPTISLTNVSGGEVDMQIGGSTNLVINRPVSATSFSGIGSALTALTPGNISGGATNQVLAFGSAAGWTGNPQINNQTNLGVLNLSSSTSSKPLIMGDGKCIQFKDSTTTIQSSTSLFYDVPSGSGHIFRVSSGNKLSVGVNGATITGDEIVTGSATATNGVFGAYGCMTMSTGVVSVATSASTNKFTAFSYVKTFGGIGSLTNTAIVVTNAGDYSISFGCSMLGGNADQVKTLIITNDVVCTLIMFEKTMQSPAVAETGFKEVVVNLPAACRVGIGIANLSATATSIQNLCLNVKGAN